MGTYEIVTTVLSLGVGGVLGIVIFLMYRKDRTDTEERWASLASELVECRSKENRTRLKQAKALTELTAQLRRMNGRS
jgi:hypothetical protein